jgi:hypothetical protein
MDASVLLYHTKNGSPSSSHKPNWNATTTIKNTPPRSTSTSSPSSSPPLKRRQFSPTTTTFSSLGSDTNSDTETNGSTWNSSTLPDRRTKKDLAQERYLCSYFSHPHYIVLYNTLYNIASVHNVFISLFCINREEFKKSKQKSLEWFEKSKESFPKRESPSADTKKNSSEIVCLNSLIFFSFLPVFVGGGVVVVSQSFYTIYFSLLPLFLL